MTCLQTHNEQNMLELPEADVPIWLESSGDCADKLQAFDSLQQPCDTNIVMSKCMRFAIVQAAATALVTLLEAYMKPKRSSL